MLLHDSIIDYGGRPCRMELAISVDRYVAEVAAAKQDLAAERKLVTCIEQLVMSTDFTAAVNSMLQTIIEHYDADRAYIFEFDWTRDVTHNTYEICRDGVTPEKENLQNVPIEVVALWVDIFQNQHRKINIIEDVDGLKDDPARRIEYDCLHPQGIKSLITVPIFVSGELHGFLGVDNLHAHMNAPEMLAQITYIAANELQKRTLTDELTVKSYLDPLTGLRNRLAYDEALGYLLGKEVPSGLYSRSDCDAAVSRTIIVYLSPFSEGRGHCPRLLQALDQWWSAWRRYSFKSNTGGAPEQYSNATEYR